MTKYQVYVATNPRPDGLWSWGLVLAKGEKILSEYVGVHAQVGKNADRHAHELMAAAKDSQFEVYGIAVLPDKVSHTSVLHEPRLEHIAAAQALSQVGFRLYDKGLLVLDVRQKVKTESITTEP